MAVGRRAWARAVRRDGNGPPFVGWPVARARPPAVCTRVPDALLRIDGVVAFVAVLVEPRRVEDVELGLGAVVRRGGDARLHEMLLGLLCYIPRLSRISLARHRIHYFARDRQR